MDDIDDQDASERSPESVAGASPVASTIFFSFQISRHQLWLVFAR